LKHPISTPKSKRIEKMAILNVHPLANLFPKMNPEEYVGLKADIQIHGLREPIWLYEGQIIDGANRYRACLELGIEPRFRTWEGEQDSLVNFILSINLHRRHLDSGQKAAIAVDMLPLLEAEALARKKALCRDAARKTPSPETIEREGQKIDALADPHNSGKAAKLAADWVGTNRQYVAEAKQIKLSAPEVFQDLHAGKVSMQDAKLLAAASAPTRKAILERVTAGAAKNIRHALKLVRREEAAKIPPPTGKYRVIYADPPWQYGNSGLQNYGHAESHYPTMSIEEICRLPIRALAEENAVLFLWVTAPLLMEANAVIEAWGFRYKTNLVWDKQQHNFGYYLSMRHEHLLIATRGSCLPDLDDLLPSIQAIPRSSRHSEKPEAFRKLIERLYRYGNYLELFARKQTEGWTAWGDSVP
jgi:N6-adenosine-specific RNA methylase IME4